MGVLRKLRIIYKQEGLKGIKNRLFNKAKQSVNKIDIIGFYKYTYDLPIIELNEIDKINNKIENNKIIVNWIIPDLGIGSGGHINIFRFINYLKKKGHVNRIYIFNQCRFDTNKDLQNFVHSHYNLKENIELYKSTNNIQFAHATVATSWDTTYFVKSFNNTLKKFYFVQDFEPYFYPVGSEYILAEQTYSMGFFGLTAGGWLKEKLSSDYGMKCESFSFSYDKHLYKHTPKRDKVKRVLFYSRPVTPRRSFEIGLMALNLLHEKMPDVGVIFAGWDISNYHIPFPHLNAGSVALEELGDLYSQCHIVLTLSGTNLSLLPLEVMACKTAIMSNRGPNAEWLLNDENSILCDFNVTDIAFKLEQYLKDEDKLNKIIEKGYEFAINTDWDKEGLKVENAMLKELI